MINNRAHRRADKNIAEYMFPEYGSKHAKENASQSPRKTFPTIKFESVSSAHRILYIFCSFGNFRRPPCAVLVFVYVYKTSVVNMCPNAHLTCNPDLRADFHVRMALGCGEDNNPNTEIDENSESEDSDEQEPEPDWDE